MNQQAHPLSSSIAANVNPTAAKRIRRCVMNDSMSPRRGEFKSSLVHVLERQHGQQPLFLHVVEAAGGRERLRILVGAEEHVAWRRTSDVQHRAIRVSGL